MGENRALFLFQTMDDLDRVLQLGPWSYDKYLLILHKLQAGDSAQKACLERVSFWVQIHGLPTMSQTKEVGMCIGETLGVVEKVDVDDSGFCMGEFLRIRVSLNITEPLCRGRKIRLGRENLRWVDFKYERLPIFCYWCGMMDHDEKECLLWIRSKETLRLEEKQFGAWLRASPERNQKPQLIMATVHGGHRVEGVETKTKERLVSNPKAPTQMGQVTGKPRVDKSELANLVRNDVDVTRLMKDCAVPIKPLPELGKDFEKQLAEIDAGIHGEVSQMMKGKGSEKEEQENGKGQPQKHSLTPLSMSDADISSCPGQQGIVGLNGANGPFMDLTMDITTDRAQPVGEFKFAARSPNSLHGNNPTKLVGKAHKEVEEGSRRKEKIT